MVRLVLVLFVLFPFSTHAQVLPPGPGVLDTADSPEDLAEQPVPSEDPEPLQALVLSNEAPLDRVLLGEVWSDQLDNGLRIVGRHDPRRSTAAVCVSYGVGSRDDPDGHTGLAHLTEHMMFAPMERLPRGMGGLLESAGALYFNASTASNETRYCEELPDGSLDLALFGEAERMAYLLASLTEAQVATQRRVVLNEALERGRGGPGEQLQRLDMELLYPEDHARRRGKRPERDVEGLRLRDVQWFHQRFYGPANAVIAIVSPRENEAVLARVRHYFAHVRGHSPPDRIPAEPVALEESARVEFGSQLIHPGIRMTWPTPRFRAEGDAALDFVGTRLQRLLDEEFLQFNLTGVDARQSSGQNGSEFRITTRVGPRVNLEWLRSRIDRAIVRVQTELPDAREFAALRARWRTIRLDTPVARASALCSSVLHEGIPWTDEVERARYEAVTPEDVRAAAQDHLPLSRRILVFYTHDYTAREARVRVGWGER